MQISVIVPFYDDRQEALRMAQAVRRSVSAPHQVQLLLVGLCQGCNQELGKENFHGDVEFLAAPTLPAAKNRAVRAAKGKFLLFLFPPLLPSSGALQIMVHRLEQDPTLSAVVGRWFNESGKVEIGYNVRRFPTLLALLLDILLLNKLVPRNRVTRAYKQQDFDHSVPSRVEHANDSMFMVRRTAIFNHGGFNETYSLGWFDQVEFCQSLNGAGEQILFEPSAEFVSNNNAPLINRLVRDHYDDYRAAECLYIRNHFGRLAGGIARGATATGMVFRIGFSLLLPTIIRKRLLSRFRSYVDDDYVCRLRRTYWKVLKRCIRGEL